MPTSRRRAPRPWFLLVLVAAPLTAHADVRISEIGVTGGLLFPDTDVAGDGPGAEDLEPAFGLRLAVPKSDRLTFVADGSFARVESARSFGLANMIALRGGARWFTGRASADVRFFLDAGVGWMRLDLEHRVRAVDRPFLAFGVGQLFRVSDRVGFHWQLRAEGTLSDDGDPIRGAIAQPAALIGLSVLFPEPRDTDRDGVADDRDACADTPRGALVDGNGCPRDEDLDGVPDGLDRCAATPRGVPVDGTGCSVVADSDRDGVPDGLDRCPGTGGGVLVDAAGCPEEPLFEVAGPVVLTGVSFATASERLTARARDVLNDVAASLIEHTELRVEIAGHADSSENDGGDLALRRARSVRAYLLARGVSGSVLVVRAYGAGAPAADNGTAEGRAANRRVDLSRIGGDAAR